MARRGPWDVVLFVLQSASRPNNLTRPCARDQAGISICTAPTQKVAASFSAERRQSMEKPQTLRVAIVGLGAIGRKVAEALDRGIDGLALTAVSAQHTDKHRNWLAGLAAPPKMLPIEALPDVADLVVECA